MKLDFFHTIVNRVEVLALENSTCLDLSLFVLDMLFNERYIYTPLCSFILFFFGFHFVCMFVVYDVCFT